MSPLPTFGVPADWSEHSARSPYFPSSLLWGLGFFRFSVSLTKSGDWGQGPLPYTFHLNTVLSTGLLPTCRLHNVLSGSLVFGCICYKNNICRSVQGVFCSVAWESNLQMCLVASGCFSLFGPHLLFLSLENFVLSFSFNFFFKNITKHCHGTSCSTSHFSIFVSAISCRRKTPSQCAPEVFNTQVCSKSFKPNPHWTRARKFERKSFWCCLRTVWTLPFTSTGSICLLQQKMHVEI